MRHGYFIGLLASASIAVASPAVAHELSSETANKQVVLDFYKALNDADAAGTTRQRIQAIAEKYIGPDYVQHDPAFANLPGSGSARDKLIRMFQSMPPMKPMPAARTVAVMAEGDRVMMLTARDMPDPTTGAVQPAYIFNMFRVKDHLLVEHWDVGTPGMPPPGAGAAPGAMPPPKP
jgi:predicted SnoaL-like aldol condensation-catalyzing enzyme